MKGLFLALLGLGVGLAFMVIVWFVIDRGAKARRLKIDDRDIYRSAGTFIDQHGAAAKGEAAMQAEKCLAAGDLEGEAIWLRMVQVIEELQSGKRPDEAEAC